MNGSLRVNVAHNKAFLIKSDKEDLVRITLDC